MLNYFENNYSLAIVFNGLIKNLLLYTLWLFLVHNYKDNGIKDFIGLDNFELFSITYSKVCLVHFMNSCSLDELH